jgi:hypothetical protein
LICLGLTKIGYAGEPLIVTETPSSAVGNLLPVKSAACHDRVTGERFAPMILI